MSMTDSAVRTYSLGEYVDPADYAGTPYSGHACGVSIHTCEDFVGGGQCTMALDHKGPQHVAAYGSGLVCGIGKRDTSGDEPKLYAVGDASDATVYAPDGVRRWCSEGDFPEGSYFRCSLPRGHKGPQHVAANMSSVVGVKPRDTSGDEPEAAADGDTPKRYAVGEFAPRSLRPALRDDWCLKALSPSWLCTLPKGHGGPQHLSIGGAIGATGEGSVQAAEDVAEPIVEQPTPEVLAERLREAQEARDNADRLARDRGAEIDRLNERYEAFRKTVVKVARQKAREHDWCSVVDQALRDMGLGDVEYEQRYRVTTDVWIEHNGWEARQDSVEVVVESTRGAADAWRDVDGANEEQAIDMLNAAGIYVPDGWEFSRFDASTGYADVVDED